MSAVSESIVIENPRGAWLTRARGVARNLAAQRGSVTIDEVRALCPPPDDVDPRVMGAVFKRPEFELVDYIESRRKVCHGRHIGIFRLRG
jgi:hypothetical protein